MPFSATCKQLVSPLALGFTLLSSASALGQEGTPTVPGECALYQPIAETTASEGMPSSAFPSAEAWEKAVVRPVANLVRGPRTTSDDLSATFRVLWTTKELYVRVDVSDAGGSTVVNSPFAWEDDSVEVYVDADGSRLSSYGPNDFQFIARTNHRGIIGFGVNSTVNTWGVRITEEHSSAGYTMIWSIPWVTLGTEPELGQFIGMDVQVNDDDDQGPRDNKIAAFALTDAAWESPRRMGMLRLGSP